MLFDALVACNQQEKYHEYSKKIAGDG
jgi:hypothetical protein